MPVLGVLVTISRDSIGFTIEEERLRFWREELAHLQQSSGPKEFNDATSPVAWLAAWSSRRRQHGARLRGHAYNGLYKIASKGFRGSLQAELDLEWLLRLMGTAPPTTSRPLVPRTDPPLVLYTDASGHPLNGFGAVFIDGDSTLWTGCRCPESLVSSLSDRATQIKPLEVCGVILGLWTFHQILVGRRVIVYMDNQAALGAIRKGRSSVPDFNELVFFARGICSSYKTGPVFIWVPSDLNWADAPSRYSANSRVLDSSSDEVAGPQLGAPKRDGGGWHAASPPSARALACSSDGRPPRVSVRLRHCLQGASGTVPLPGRTWSDFRHGASPRSYPVVHECDYDYDYEIDYDHDYDYDYDLIATATTTTTMTTTTATTTITTTTTTRLADSSLV